MRKNINLYISASGSLYSVFEKKNPFPWPKNTYFLCELINIEIF